MNDDLISRQAVTDTTICDGISCNECSFNTCEDGQLGCLLKERVDKLPSVNPQEPCSNCCNGNQIEKAKLCQKSYLAGMEHPQEPKTGHWINIIDKDLHDYRTGNKLCFECSECRSQYTYKFNYCPNCGCRMFEPQESEG